VTPIVSPAAFVLSLAAAAPSPVDSVSVFTGTSNSRWMLGPGPTLPFGMVKLSPDNQGNVWNGGYEAVLRRTGPSSFEGQVRSARSSWR
jgi:putative alpha-1,2-mannosidase